MLAATREALAFPDAVVAKAGNVLAQLLDCDDAKERRLAAERIRDERGLTRIVKPTEQHYLHVSIDPAILELAAQHRRLPQTLRPPVTDGWKPMQGHDALPGATSPRVKPVSTQHG